MVLYDPALLDNGYRQRLDENGNPAIANLLQGRFFLSSGGASEATEVPSRWDAVGLVGLVLTQAILAGLDGENFQAPSRALARSRQVRLGVSAQSRTALSGQCARCPPH